MNVDKFINKICNSLTHSSSHWSINRYEMKNKYTRWGIWIANKEYGVHIWKQGDWRFNQQLDESLPVKNMCSSNDLSEKQKQNKKLQS